MKHILLTTVFILLLSCSGGRDNYKHTYAENWDWEQYDTKTISYIQYCKYCGPGGNYLILNFTDGTRVKIYNYKYTLEVHW